MKNSGHPVLIVKRDTENFDTPKYIIKQRVMTKPLALIGGSKGDFEAETSEYTIPLSIKQQNGTVVKHVISSSVSDIDLKNDVHGEWVLVSKWNITYHFSSIGNNMRLLELVILVKCGKVL